MHHSTEHGGQLPGGRANVHPSSAHNTATGLPHRGVQAFQHFGLHLGPAQCHQPGDSNTDPHPWPRPEPETESQSQPDPDPTAEAVPSCWQQALGRR